MTDIGRTPADIHRQARLGRLGWYFGNPGAVSGYSISCGSTCSCSGWGDLRSHLFTAGSQTSKQPFVASQLLYGSPLALRCPTCCAPTSRRHRRQPIVSHGSAVTAPASAPDARHRQARRTRAGDRSAQTETAAQFEWLGMPRRRRLLIAVAAIG